MRRALSDWVLARERVAVLHARLHARLIAHFHFSIQGGQAIPMRDGGLRMDCARLLFSFVFADCTYGFGYRYASILYRIHFYGV